MKIEFTIDSSNLYMILNEVQLFKNYIKTQTDENIAFTVKDILEGDSLSFFGTEIFKFWLQGFMNGSTEESVFIDFAKTSGLPVIDHDTKSLSWIGRVIYAVWVEAINSHKL